MKQCNNVTMKSGFTLMEAIVAITIITVGIVGVFSLVTQTISSATYSKDRLTAAYLAQEGVEIIRNIRDTNWMEQYAEPTNPWDEGLTNNCPGDVDNCSTSPGCIADYADSEVEEPDLPVYANQLLYIDGNGFYNRYSLGTQTKFQRKIVIEPDGSDILRICVLIEWQEKGRNHQIEVRENLYDWKKKY